VLISSEFPSTRATGIAATGVRDLLLDLAGVSTALR